MDHEALAARIASRIAPQRAGATPGLRAARREVSRELRACSGADVLKIVLRLLHDEGCPRWLAYEIAHFHEDAMAQLSGPWIERLGAGLSDWGEVDPFALYLLGPAWREGNVASSKLRGWARSPDRWRRRSALVATVALNCTARGGDGDAPRTLEICDLLLDDRDDMVVKGLSWALRELALKRPAEVEAYLAANEPRLAARALREVRNKLRTGLENPGRRAG